MLHDGRQVVVKVQRPEIQAKVHADLGVMEELAAVGEERFASFRRMGVREIVEEFAAGVREELDYTVEAYNARRLADVLRTVQGVDVPTVYPELSSRRVLVMDFVVGVKATRVDELEAGVDRVAVGHALVSALIKQLLLDGFFHGDPHPGNVLLDPKTGRVTFLDLGLMGELQLDQRLDLMALVWALRVEEPTMLTSVVRRLCRPVGPVDEEAYRQGMERIYFRAWRYGSGELSGVMLLVFDLLGAQHLRMRRELVLAVKALTQAEELISAIDPDLPLIPVIVEEAKGLIGDQLTALTDQAKAGDTADLVRLLAPHAMPILGERLLPAPLAAALGMAAGTTTAPAPQAVAPGGAAGAAGGPQRLGRIATALSLVGVCIAAAIVAGTGEVGGPRDTEALRWLAVGATALTGAGSLMLARRWSVRDADERAATAARGGS